MAAMGQMGDPELANAFAELSMKKIQAEGQIRLSNAQIDSLNRKIQHSQIVQHEIGGLPSDVRVFKAVGRMFLLQSQDVMKADLSKNQQAYTEKIKTLESSKEYLQRNIEECKNSVREMVKTKQGGTS